MKLWFFVILILINSISASEFIVATSANMQYALEDLNKEYAKESGKLFKTVISSSGKLTAQIKSGAPFSVFLSADMNFPLSLYVSKYAIEKPKVYAKGTIVLWTLGNWDLKYFPSFLLNDKLKFIALANPETAPYGKEAIRILKYYSLYEKVKSKLVYAESISQVNQYTLSGSADIGFTAKSVVTSSEMKDKGTWIEMDANAYNPIEQGMVILKYGLDNHPIESKSFYNFIFSNKAKAVFKKNGYIIDGL